MAGFVLATSHDTEDSEKAEALHNSETDTCSNIPARQRHSGGPPHSHGAQQMFSFSVGAVAVLR